MAPIIATWVDDIDLAGLAHPYVVIFTFVVFDAVIPVFPSESLLTTASNLAAQDGSTIEIWRLVVAGSLGAIIGDSLLYWLSRTVLRRYVAGKVDKAQQNEKVARSMEVMSRTAPTLIVFGRFVPGLRFMVNATMGLTKHRYPELSAVERHRRNAVGLVHLHLQLPHRHGDQRPAGAVDRRVGGGDDGLPCTALQAAEEELGRDRRAARSVTRRVTKPLSARIATRNHPARGVVIREISATVARVDETARICVGFGLGTDPVPRPRCT